MSREKTEPVAKAETVSKPRRITLQYLLKNDLPVWVINRGSKKVGSGILVCQVGDKDNWKSLPIPPGNDPVCLTDMVPSEMLKTCFDLHREIDAGALELLDPDNAEEYYSTREDRRRVMQEKLRKYMSKDQNDVPEPKKIRFGDDDALETRGFRRFREDGLPKDMNMTRQPFAQSGPKPKLSDLCLRAQANAVDEKVMFEEVLEMSSSLTPIDLDFLVRNGSFDSVRSWASDQLKEKK